jgi:hypothetical protein
MHVEAARKHCLSAVCYGIITYPFILQSHYKIISERSRQAGSGQVKSSQAQHSTAQYIPALHGAASKTD